MVKTSLGILLLLCLAKAELNKLPEEFDQLCQALKCNPSTEICQFDDNCYDRNPSNSSRCVFCTAQKTQKKLLAKSVSKPENSVEPKLLAKSVGSQRILASNRVDSSKNKVSTSTDSMKNILTIEDTNFDDYYAYDEDETSDKNDLGEEDDYLDDYAEPFEKIIENIDPLRRAGVCSRIVSSNVRCDDSIFNQTECRFDTDCPADEKCCETTCAKRVCSKPIPASFSVCPTSFTCSLNCRLGYRTDENGCLLCQCLTCQSLDQCQKSCPAGYLKDLFGCNICECVDPCPSLDCNLTCPLDTGFVKSKDGCPLCQCIQPTPIQIQTLDRTSSCQDDVHCPPGFRCLNDAKNVPMCRADTGVNSVARLNPNCPRNLLDNCDVECPMGVYAVDYAGCSICACPSTVPEKPKECPMMKCRANCDQAGYRIDENGCQTCDCINPPIVKPRVECSRVMCRMFCTHGFSRDENGCEICKCNSSPQPCPSIDCQNDCPNGYRKDYSGCQTCSCEEDKKSQVPIVDGCATMNCDLNCKYGYERDLSGCPLCSCNRCPLQTCRMFCMYGFKKNSDNCDVCECDWSPISEKIACSERIPCTGNHVCNINMQLCETVSADKVNWFVYKFNVQTDLFRDYDFSEAFKRGLINNIAAKYDFEIGQITISSVESDGTTSFQIMPFFNENLDDFQRKIDQVDLDLNTNEFNKVIPSVVTSISKQNSGSKLGQYFQKHPRALFFMATITFIFIAVILAGIFTMVCRQNRRFNHRSDSKLPIYETSYHQAPTEDDHYHAVHAPDGTAYVVVESDEMNPSNEKRAIV